jgi:putative acetyltransferase
MQEEVREIIINAESPYDIDSATLLAELTVELSKLYGDDGGANSFSPGDVTVNNSSFLVARRRGKAIGCGALRPLSTSTAEVKRMYVTREARRLGVGARLLRELEVIAEKFGYERVRLETGLKQPEAIALYESAGYRRVDCHGQYVSNALSICFEKALR